MSTKGKGFHRTVAALLVLSSVFLFSTEALSWAEAKHYVDDFQVHQVLITDEYVFFATSGFISNHYGLFIYERRKDKWTNYCVANGAPGNLARKLEKEGNILAVNYHERDKTGDIHILQSRFDLEDLSKKIIRKEYQYTSDYYNNPEPIYEIKEGEALYNLYENSVEKVTTNPDDSSKTESIWPPLDISAPKFTYPVEHNNKIYFVYGYMEEEWAYMVKGVGVFDPNTEKYHFYETDIFDYLMPTMVFVRSGSFVYPTAYKGMDGDWLSGTTGFIEFVVKDKAFRKWPEVRLPEYPLAIISIDEDNKEYWFGTDKGIFRSDKQTKKLTHYTLDTKAVVGVEKTLVWTDASWEPPENKSKKICALERDDVVKLIAEWEGWCEIESPCEALGFIDSDHVERLIGPKHLQINRKSKIRNSPHKEADVIVEFPGYLHPAESYKVVGEAVMQGQDGDKQKWYAVSLPTAWVMRDDLIYGISEADEEFYIEKFLKKDETE